MADESMKVRIGADLTGFKNALNKATNLAKGSAKAIALAFASVTAASALIGSKFEQAITETATVANAFGKDLDALSNKAKELGKSTAFSATEAAKGMYALASSGMDTKQIIDATEYSMKLAGATASEMAQATGLVAASLKQFGMRAEETKRVTDTYAAAITSSQLTLERLTEAMKYAGTTGASLGWSIEETTAAVAQFANLGLEGTMAGTNLRMAMIALTKGTDNAKKALLEMNLTLEDINPETHNFGQILETLGEHAMTSSQAVDIFGTRAGLNMKRLSEQAALAKGEFMDFVKMLLDAQEGVGRTAEMYNRMMDTFSGQWKVMLSAIQYTLTEFFEVYKDYGKKAFTFLATEIVKFGDKIKEHKTDIILAAHAMAEGILDAFNLIVKGIGMVIKAVPQLRTVLMAVVVKWNELQRDALIQEREGLEKALAEGANWWQKFNNFISGRSKEEAQADWTRRIQEINSELIQVEANISAGTEEANEQLKVIENIETGITALTDKSGEYKLKIQESSEEIKNAGKVAEDTSNQFAKAIEEVYGKSVEEVQNMQIDLLEADIQAKELALKQQQDYTEKATQLTKDQLETLATLYTDMRGYEQENYEISMQLLEQRTQGYLEQLEGVKNAEEIVNEWRRQQERIILEEKLKASEEWVDGVKAAMMEIEDAYKTWGETAYEIVTGTYNSLKDSFKELFVDTFTGELDSLGDYWDAFCDRLKTTFINAIADMLAQGITKSLMGGLSNLLGSLNVGSISGSGGLLNVLGTDLGGGGFSLGGIVSSLGGTLKSGYNWLASGLGLPGIGTTGSGMLTLNAAGELVPATLSSSGTYVPAVSSGFALPAFGNNLATWAPGIGAAYGIGSDLFSGNYNEAIGGAIGAGIGSFLGPIGLGIGQVVGDIIGGALGPDAHKPHMTVGGGLSYNPATGMYEAVEAAPTGHEYQGDYVSGWLRGSGNIQETAGALNDVISGIIDGYTSTLNETLDLFRLFESEKIMDTERESITGWSGIWETLKKMLSGPSGLIDLTQLPGLELDLSFHSGHVEENVEAMLERIEADMENHTQKVAEILGFGYGEAAVEAMNEWLAKAHAAIEASATAITGAFAATLETGDFSAFEADLKQRISSTVQEAVIAAFMEAEIINRALAPFFMTLQTSMEDAMAGGVFDPDTFMSAMQPAIDNLPAAIGSLEPLFNTVYDTVKQVDTAIVGIPISVKEATEEITEEVEELSHSWGEQFIASWYDWEDRGIEAWNTVGEAISAGQTEKVDEMIENWRHIAEGFDAEDLADAFGQSFIDSIDKIADYWEAFGARFPEVLIQATKDSQSAIADALSSALSSGGGFEDFKLTLKQGLAQTVQEAVIEGLVNNVFIKNALQPFFLAIEEGMTGAMSEGSFNLHTFMESVGPAIDDLGTVIKNLEPMWNVASDVVDDINEAILGGTEAANASADAAEKAQQSASAASEAAANASDAANKINEATEMLSKAAAAGNLDEEKVKQIVNKITEALTDAQDTAAAIISDARTAANSMISDAEAAANNLIAEAQASADAALEAAVHTAADVAQIADLVHQSIVASENIVNAMSGIASSIERVVNSAEQIADSIYSAASSISNVQVEVSLADIESYDKGTQYVTHDQLALVHRGEKITPPGRSAAPSQPQQVNVTIQADVITTDDIPGWLNKVVDMVNRTSTGAGIRVSNPALAGLVTS